MPPCATTLPLGLIASIRVLEPDDLDIVLQPIVDLSTGRVVGAEALSRFPDGRGPDQWFHDASLCGQSGTLDAIAFTAATEQLRSVPKDVYLAVNATPELILDPVFERRLAALGPSLDQLVVEITEHSPVADYAELTSALDPWRRRGMRLAGCRSCQLHQGAGFSAPGSTAGVGVAIRCLPG